ncbi:uncharacterized protein L199_004648 [Kwoniella botswanensis]|uniref:uncharacterized protein n=1 Tax=Kwoniella botswanensis TaxID=1268659 RepID=UPI00315D2F32
MWYHSTTTSTTDDQSTFSWYQREQLRRIVIGQGVGSEKADELVTGLTTENPTAHQGSSWCQLVEMMSVIASREAYEDSIGQGLGYKGKDPQR